MRDEQDIRKLRDRLEWIVNSVNFGNLTNQRQAELYAALLTLRWVTEGQTEVEALFQELGDTYNYRNN